VKGATKVESISNALRKFAGGRLIREGEERARAVLNDPLIVKFRSKYPQLDDLTLKLNMNRLHQYATEYRNCEKCPGLSNCPNDMPGHYTVLSAETVGDASYIHELKATCKKQLAENNRQVLRSRIRTYHVDDRALFGDVTFGDILEKDLDRTMAVHQINRYIIETTEQGLKPTGLYLCGSFGTGKTFLMCYMLHKLAKEGYTGAIVYMPEFAEDLKGMFGDNQKLRETVEALKETDLLVFDDIGAENLNPWLRDHVLGSILNHRMNRKPTFFTSNYDLDGLEKHIAFTAKDGDEEYKGRRIMDRIRPFVEVVSVEGTNKRGQ